MRRYRLAHSDLKLPSVIKSVSIKTSDYFLTHPVDFRLTGTCLLESAASFVRTFVADDKRSVIGHFT